MSRPPLKTGERHAALWPVDMTRYNRSPVLTPNEQEALGILVTQLAWKKRIEISGDLQHALARLLQPLYDLQAQLGIYQRYCTTPVQILLRAMYEHSTAYWAWSEEEWLRLLQSTFAQLQQCYDAKMYHLARQQLLLLAYVLGPQTIFFWPLLQEMAPATLAAKLFGTAPLLEAIDRIYAVLRQWGYEEDSSLRSNMTTTVALVFLANHSPRLEAMTFSLLSRLYTLALPYHRKQLERLSRVLAHWGLIATPLLSGNEKRRVRASRGEY